MEFRWDTVKAKLAHAAAVVAGRRIVQRGDTAAYEVREVRDATYSWSTVGGTLQSDPSSSTAVVKWNATDSVGTLIVSRTWPGGCKDETRINVTLPVLVSVDEPADEVGSDITQPGIMPNPANDLVRVAAPFASTIEIIDVHGRNVLRRDVSAGGHDLDISALAQGTYYVRFVMPMTTRVIALTVRR